jgi:hypothetical protein
MITNIKITGCKDLQLWYANYIDAVYDVITYDYRTRTYLVATYTGNNIVYEEDCVPWDLKDSLSKAQEHFYSNKTPAKEDVVNSPPHYNKGGVECIEALQAALTTEEFEGYLKGNAMKYLWRCNLKNNKLQDLHKAQWYLNRLIEVQNNVFR